MAELIIPTVVERLQACEKGIQDFAEGLDLEPEDVDIEVCKRTKESLAVLVPEIEGWRDTKLEVVTALAHYALDDDTWYGQKLESDDPFLMSGTFKDIFLEKVLLDLDSEEESSKYRMYMRFVPDIRSDESNLVIADSVIVPPSGLEVVADSID